MTVQHRNGRTPASAADPPPVVWQAGDVDPATIRQTWHRQRTGEAPPAAPVPPPPPAAPAAPFGGATERLRRAVEDTLADWFAGHRPAPGGAGGGGRGGRLGAPSGFSGSLRVPQFRRLWWAYGLAALVAFGALFQIGVAVNGLVRDRLTTWEYGAVRTSHLRAYFGFKGETPATPTLLTAVNDGAWIHVFILPAGSAAAAQVLELPWPGDPAGRVPVRLGATDADLDGHPDLLLAPADGGPALVYLLDTGNGTFRPPSAEEQSRLVLPEVGP